MLDQPESATAADGERADGEGEQSGSRQNAARNENPGTAASRSETEAEASSSSAAVESAPGVQWHRSDNIGINTVSKSSTGSEPESQLDAALGILGQAYDNHDGSPNRKTMNTNSENPDGQALTSNSPDFASFQVSSGNLTNAKTTTSKDTNRTTSKDYLNSSDIHTCNSQSSSKSSTSTSPRKNRKRTSVFRSEKQKVASSSSRSPQAVGRFVGVRDPVSSFSGDEGRRNSTEDGEDDSSNAENLTNGEEEEGNSTEEDVNDDMNTGDRNADNVEMKHRSPNDNAGTSGTESNAVNESASSNNSFVNSEKNEDDQVGGASAGPTNLANGEVAPPGTSAGSGVVQLERAEDWASQPPSQSVAEPPSQSAVEPPSALELEPPSTSVAEPTSITNSEVTGEAPIYAATSEPASQSEPISQSDVSQSAVAAAAVVPEPASQAEPVMQEAPGDGTPPATPPDDVVNVGQGTPPSQAPPPDLASRTPDLASQTTPPPDTAPEAAQEPAVAVPGTPTGSGDPGVEEDDDAALAMRLQQQMLDEMADAENNATATMGGPGLSGLSPVAGPSAGPPASAGPLPTSGSAGTVVIESASGAGSSSGATASGVVNESDTSDTNQNAGDGTNQNAGESVGLDAESSDDYAARVAELLAVPDLVDVYDEYDCAVLDEVGMPVQVELPPGVTAGSYDALRCAADAGLENSNEVDQGADNLLNSSSRNSQSNSATPRGDRGSASGVSASDFVVRNNLADPPASDFVARPASAVEETDAQNAESAEAEQNAAAQNTENVDTTDQGQNAGANVAGGAQLQSIICDGGNLLGPKILDLYRSNKLHDVTFVVYSKDGVQDTVGMNNNLDTMNNNFGGFAGNMNADFNNMGGFSNPMVDGFGNVVEGDGFGGMAAGVAGGVAGGVVYPEGANFAPMVPDVSNQNQFQMVSDFPLDVNANDTAGFQNLNPGARAPFSPGQPGQQQQQQQQQNAFSPRPVTGANQNAFSPRVEVDANGNQAMATAGAENIVFDTGMNDGNWGGQCINGQDINGNMGDWNTNFTGAASYGNGGAQWNPNNINAFGSGGFGDDGVRPVRFPAHR